MQVSTHTILGYNGTTKAKNGACIANNLLSTI
jgi:hypothetical protein